MSAVTESPAATTCYHCGDTCNEIVNKAGKIFCCTGCETVYDLLHNYGLDNYYELNKNPGTRTDYGTGCFSFLDNEEITAKLTRKYTEYTSGVTLKLPAIHCSSCIWLLENLPGIVPGIVTSRVNFTHRTATFTFHHAQITLRSLVEFIARLGYEPDISTEEKPTTTNKDQLVTRLAVAGFCFGNAMLLSFPFYLDTGQGVDGDLSYLFGWLSILLCLPVITYCAWPYYSAALAGLRNRYISIDVPVVLGIFMLFLQTVVEIGTVSGTGYADSLAGLIFFLLIGKWFRNKTYQAMSFERSYRSFFPIAVRSYSNPGKFIPLEDLQSGDRIIISNGEVIPADCQLLQGKAFIDYSFVTGESGEESVSPGQQVYAGGKQKGASIVLQVAKLVSAGYLADLWNSPAAGKKDSRGLRQLTDRISAKFTAAVLSVAFLTGIYWYLTDATKMLTAVSSVMIIACPCALALALPFAYGHAIRFMGRQKLYLRNAGVVESIAKASQLIFDKTGTLTVSNHSQVTLHGEPLATRDAEILLGATDNSSHPYSRLISAYLKEKYNLVGNPEVAEKFQEVPGSGIVATIKNRRVKAGSAAFLEVEGENNGEATVYFSIDKIYGGCFSIENTYRPGLFQMLHRLKSKFSLHLLSGDRDHEKQKLNPYFPKMSFRQSPADKLAYAHRCRKKGVTIVLGDGLNDAGALKVADVGIAVAENTHQFSPACNAILMGEKMSQLDRFLQFCRYTYLVVKIALGISIGYNLVGLYFAVTAQLTPVISAILMPLSSVTVVVMITLLLKLKADQLFRKDNSAW